MSIDDALEVLYAAAAACTVAGFALAAWSAYREHKRRDDAGRKE